MSWIDLHMHSSYSDDAELAPEALMDRCLKTGVRTAALADHNTAAGVRAAQKRAAVTGVTLLPAIELDCFFGQTHLHILGYGIDADYAPFAQIEADVLEQEQSAAQKRIRLVQEYGIHVDENEVMRRAQNGIASGELIAEVAMEDARNRENPMMEPYLPGGEFGDNPFVHFYWNLCAKGGPADIPLTFITLEEAVGHIHRAGGAAVLAHPGNNIHEDEALLAGIVAAGVGGMEVYSSYHSPQQTAFYKESAAQLGLAPTCGSDFHGKTKPTIELGSIDCDGQESQLLEGLLELCGLLP